MIVTRLSRSPATTLPAAVQQPIVDKRIGTEHVPAPGLSTVADGEHQECPLPLKARTVQAHGQRPEVTNE